MATAPDHDIVEVEWQFDAPDCATVLGWLAGAAIPGYTVTAGPGRQLRDTYLDTEDWRLHRAGFTCRVREKDRSAELTLKSMAEATDGIRRRREMTETLDGCDPEHARTAPGPCGQALRLVAGRWPLRTLFTLEQERRTFTLADAAGPLGEIAVDDTTVVAGADRPEARLSRVEVEVDDGAVERARRFVDVLAVAAGLRPAGVSKFQWALAATGQQPYVPENSLGATEVTDAMTAADVAFAVMRKQFGAFLANQGGTRLGEDIEALHDMRVAARRLRAAMSAFRPYLTSRMQRIRDELGWVAAALGAVRDLDVQVERMDEWRAGFDADRAHALDAIEAHLKARRVRARKRMLAVLDSRRYDRLVVRFASSLRRGPPKSFVPGRVPILAVAPELLDRRYRQLRRQGDRIRRDSPPQDYHALRITAKKLRYALEFVGTIYGKPALDFSAKATELQDLLGLHQDADVAIAMLHEMATSPGMRLRPATFLAMGAIAERYRQHAIELRAGFPAVYRQLRGDEWRRLHRLFESRRPPAPPAAVRRRAPIGTRRRTAATPPGH